MKASPALPWVVSPRFDGLAFLGPGLASIILAFILVATRGPSNSAQDIVVWLGAILMIDVAHVWSSLYRTYADPLARQRWGKTLLALPLGVSITAFSVHEWGGPTLFWSALAYLAVFHFIKQHVGFLAIYQAKHKEPRIDRILGRAAIWANTLGPVLWWHTHLPRKFYWFTPTDFVFIPLPTVGNVALIVGPIILLAFTLGQFFRRQRRHPMVLGLVWMPAVTWTMGIVWFNDDRVFTLTNVLLHGIPYLALTFIAGGRACCEKHVWRKQVPALRWGTAALLFYFPLFALAGIEEALWDIFCWEDHPEIFGDWDRAVQGTKLSLVVSILVVPQATHYILDRYIWRPGSHYPELGVQLGFEAKSRDDDAS